MSDNLKRYIALIITVNSRDVNKPKLIIYKLWKLFDKLTNKYYKRL